MAQRGIEPRKGLLPATFSSVIAGFGSFGLFALGTATGFLLGVAALPA